jgi:hypothetical protein
MHAIRNMDSTCRWPENRSQAGVRSSTANARPNREARSAALTNANGHSTGALAVSRYGQSRLLQDTIEAGIVPKVIPDRIQFQIAVGKTKRQLSLQFHCAFTARFYCASRVSEHVSGRIPNGWREFRAANLGCTGVVISQICHPPAVGPTWGNTL